MASICCVDCVVLDLAGFAFVLFTAQPANMRVLRWCKGFAGQFCNPITELIVKLCEEATPLAVEGMADEEIGVVAASVFGEVWGI